MSIFQNVEIARPFVGIGVMVTKDGKALLGKRKGSHGQSEYAWPGGHLEYMESIVKAAKREVREETGNAHVGSFTRDKNIS